MFDFKVVEDLYKAVASGITDRANKTTDDKEIVVYSMKDKRNTIRIDIRDRKEV